MNNTTFKILLLSTLFIFSYVNLNAQRAITVNNDGEVIWPIVSPEFPYGLSVESVDITSKFTSIDSITLELSDSISELSLATPTLGETNLTAISFSNLNIDGPVGRRQTFLETELPEIDWDSDVDVYLLVNETITFSQTGTPKPGQMMSITCINTNDYNIELVWDSLGWNWQRMPSISPSNSWMTVVCSYIFDSYYADASAPSATTSTTEGGTGRPFHPSGYVLIGDGPNAVGAAAIGSGLQLTGSGQNRVLSVPLAGSTSSEREITVSTGGDNQYTNLTILNPDEFMALSANVVFAAPGGNSAFIQTYAGFEYEDGESIVVDTNQIKTPAGTSLWAGWTIGHTGNRYPVLRIGGLDGVSGVLAVNNLRYTVLDLLNVDASDPWGGYVFTESFEGSGTERSTVETSGTINHDAVDYYVHGIQSATLIQPSVSSSTKWLFSSSSGTASGRFSFRLNQSPSSLRQVFAIRDTSDNLLFYLSISTARTIRITDGNNANATTENAFPANQWITIYYEYTKGTGSNDAVAKVGWSSDGTKTSTPGNIATVPNSNMTTDANAVQIRSSAPDNWTIWWDAIVVHPTFDWSELPAGLPAGM